ncbi:Uncharacterised protein [Vibrio cholerae]|nr:Uncharacterised protein [Vibrio cholerae]
MRWRDFTFYRDFDRLHRTPLIDFLFRLQLIFIIAFWRHLHLLCSLRNTL